MTQIPETSPQRPQPVPTAETASFWDGARSGTLTLRKCSRCGNICAPLSPRCPDCLSDDLVPTACSGRASLRGRTVLHVPGLPGRKPPVAIVECAVEEAPGIVLVALDETGTTRTLAPGAPLQMEFREDPNGWSYVVAALRGKT